MAEELKSALELTLEKLNRESDATVKKLSPEQKEIIAEIRKKYKAKIADAEIMTQVRIKKAFEKGILEEVEKLRQQIVGDRQRLNRQMEKSVKKIWRSRTS